MMESAVMKIRVIVPLTTKELVATTWPKYIVAARPDTEISVIGLDRGPASLESDYEDALAVPDILSKVSAAEADGMDAVIIDCMADPGLSPARELASIPIVGPAQTAMHLAAILAHRFSVMTVLERDIPLFHRLARLYGLENNLASVRPVDIPVLELDRNRERLIEALVEQSVKAVLEDGAHIITFGCTGMSGLAKEVEQALAEQGCAVPVIDPSLAALKLAVRSTARFSLYWPQSSRPRPTPARIFDNISLPPPAQLLLPARSWVAAGLVLCRVCLPYCNRRQNPRSYPP